MTAFTKYIQLGGILQNTLAQTIQNVWFQILTTEQNGHPPTTKNIFSGSANSTFEPKWLRKNLFPGTQEVNERSRKETLVIRGRVATKGVNHRGCTICQKCPQCVSSLVPHAVLHQSHPGTPGPLHNTARGNTASNTSL